jgi:hypothetical protein
VAGNLQLVSQILILLGSTKYLIPSISDTYGSSSMKIQVYAKHLAKDDKFVGGIEDTVDSLIAKGATAGPHRPLRLVYNG